MSTLGRMMAGARELRSMTTLSNPAEWFTEALGGRTSSGESVTPRTALGMPAYWRGVNILAGSVGQLPCKVYRPTADGRSEVPHTSRPWTLLHDKPNEDMAADEYWSLVESHLDGWGNHFTWKERGPDGRIANLWPLNPSRVKVARIKGERVYVIDGDLEHPYTDYEILHFRGLSLDGLVGYSPIHIAREALGGGLARQKFRSRFWANDATPGVTLIHPGKLDPASVDRLRGLWDNRHKGAHKARTTAVLGEGVKVQQMTMPLGDAQFIEQERLGSTEIAHILGLPPHMLGGDNGGNSMTYTTTEAQAIDFIRWTLGPRLVRIQSTVTHDPDLMPVSWYAKFEPGALMRATTAERYAAWAIAPHLLVDEMRHMDDRGPLPNGEGQVLSKSTPTAPHTNIDTGSGKDGS